MNIRRFFCREVPESDEAPDGIPTWVVESEWEVRERLFVECFTRYTRLAAWLLALTTAILFFSIAASVASIHFGIAPPDGGKEIFSPSWDGSGGVRLNEHP